MHATNSLPNRPRLRFGSALIPRTVRRQKRRFCRRTVSDTRSGHGCGKLSSRSLNKSLGCELRFLLPQLARALSSLTDLLLAQDLFQRMKQEIGRPHDINAVATTTEQEPWL